MTQVNDGQENVGGKMLDALLVLYIANELLGLVARAIENGQRQVTREQVDAALARADAADAKWADAQKR
jgi:hypothetical protein